MVSFLSCHPQGYGGFVAGLLLSSKQEDFHCGVLEAPIVDFALYGKLDFFLFKVNSIMAELVLLVI